VKLCSVTRCEDEVFLGDRCIRHQDTGVGDVTADPFDPEVEALKGSVRRLSKALRDVRFELLLHDHDAMGRDRKWVWDLKKLIEAALGGA
jgi:hypothetical protein